MRLNSHIQNQKLGLNRFQLDDCVCGAGVITVFCVCVLYFVAGTEAEVFEPPKREEDRQPVDGVEGRVKLDELRKLGV